MKHQKEKPSQRLSTLSINQKRKEDRLITIGLDTSLTSTGLSVWDGDFIDAVNIKTNPSTGTDIERMSYIADAVSDFVDNYKPELIGIEDHAFHPKMGGDTRPREVAAIVKYCLYQMNYPFVLLSIRTVKKYATGDGNADKKKMLECAREIWEECPNHDVADSLHMSRFTYDNYVELRRKIETQTNGRR